MATTFSEIINSETPTLVDFFAEWCGPCRMMIPVLDKVAEKMENKVNIYKINTDENPDLAMTYEISGIPCLVLFKNGKEFTRVAGYQSESQLTKWLEDNI